MIRGKSYEECLIMLEFMPYRACEPVLNALFSAASNAKNNLGMNKAKLYVSEVYADGAGDDEALPAALAGTAFSHPQAHLQHHPQDEGACRLSPPTASVSLLKSYF